MFCKPVPPSGGTGSFNRKVVAPKKNGGHFVAVIPAKAGIQVVDMIQKNV